MINLDLLKKYTRLANNNPNEHEANVAARRVCKMLEEANWNLGTIVPPIKPIVQPTSNPGPKDSDWVRNNWKPTQAQEDFFREGRWKPPNWKPAGTSEYQQAQAQEHARQKQKDYVGDWYSYYDEMGDLGDAFWEKIKGNTKNPYQRYTEPPSPPDSSAKYDKNNKKILKCTICREDHNTGYIGHPGTYICNRCQWETFINKAK